MCGCRWMVWSGAVIVVVGGSFEFQRRLPTNSDTATMLIISSLALLAALHPHFVHSSPHHTSHDATHSSLHSNAANCSRCSYFSCLSSRLLPTTAEMMSSHQTAEDNSAAPPSKRARLSQPEPITSLQYLPVHLLELVLQHLPLDEQLEQLHSSVQTTFRLSPPPASDMRPCCSHDSHGIDHLPLATSPVAACFRHFRRIGAGYRSRNAVACPPIPVECAQRRCPLPSSRLTSATGSAQWPIYDRRGHEGSCTTMHSSVLQSMPLLSFLCARHALPCTLSTSLSST